MKLIAYSSLGVVLALISSMSFVVAEEINGKDNERIKVMAAYIPRGGGEFSFYAVGIDLLGNVIYYRFVDSDKNKHSFMKIGQKYVAYTSIKITSNPSGGVDFTFLPCTAGSSLTVIGKNGDLKDIFSLPKGVSVGLDGLSYFANIEIASPLNLPLNDNFIDPAWLKFEGVRGLDVCRGTNGNTPDTPP